MSVGYNARFLGEEYDFETYYNDDKMTEKEFDNVIEGTLDRLKDLLVVKGKEYRRNNDVFHNFHQAMKVSGRTREECIWGFALKHYVSIQDIKEDLKEGKIAKKEVLDEKYNDLLVYLLIEKASMIDKAAKRDVELVID